MAACDTWLYRNVDSIVFKRLQNVAGRQGVIIPNQPSGEFRLRVAAFSIAFGYQLDPSARTLKLTCKDKPALVGCATVKSYADKIVKDCGGVPA